ncbi:hypothetical protein OESDEN_03086 [Oesophagostomum dentatum]|uniref:Uncharacterized protein n=1 Tax=Oesophagostomum dentatum TaxID=61180 RepID=A0A0B1TM76_OESDE|nr:hypothetical protein OESDEN_03086 [Oesophagostomum dentatum]
MRQDCTTTDASTSGTSPDAVLDKTMKILEDLVLDWGIAKESSSQGQASPRRKVEMTAPKEYHQPFWRRRIKWSPYVLPKKFSPPPATDDLYTILCRIHFFEDVDVEILRLCLLEDRRDIPIACSVQAARPPTPDGEVDELSEYFAHFVRVELKMSSLAESMYV